MQELTENFKHDSQKTFLKKSTWHADMKLFIWTTRLTPGLRPWLTMTQQTQTFETERKKELNENVHLNRATIINRAYISCMLTFEAGFSVFNVVFIGLLSNLAYFIQIVYPKL